MRSPGSTVCALTCLALMALAVPRSPAAERQASPGRNDDAPAQLEQLEYLIGSWEVTSFSRKDDGPFEAAPTTSFMEARYLFDGYGVQVEFHSNDPDNFYSLAILTWDDSVGRFVMSFHNLKRNRRVRFDAERVGDELQINNRGGYAQDGDFLYRESDRKITPTSFEKRLHRSDDGGATWRELDYYFAFRRIGESAGGLAPASPGPAGAPNDSLSARYGRAGDQAPPEAAQLMFMRGDWDVTIRTRDADGEWQDSPAKPRVRGFYLEDGRTFQTTFSMGAGQTFFSTQVKAYDTTKQAWTNTFVNATRQRWATTESRWVDDELITTVPGGYGGDEPFTSREVLTEIRDGHYLMKLFRSTDDGATWVEQPMVLVFDRVDP